MNGGKVICGCLMLIGSLLGREASASQFAFRVSFTDKNNTPYSLSTPLAYLSPRAIARRTTQGIAVDSSDIPVNQTYVNDVITTTGGVLHGTSRWLNNCTILLSDSSDVLLLTGKPYISSIKLVGFFSTNLHRTAATTSGGTQRTTSGAGYYGSTWAQTSMVNGQYLHDAGYKGQGMLIAVIDAGFINTRTHEGFDSLWNSGRVVDTFNFTYKHSDVFVQDSHGTEVFSTLAGYNPGTYVGAAPLASYALYVSEYSPNEQPLELDNLLYATERADSIGADVVTESLGYDLFDYPPGAGQFFSIDLDGKTTVAAKAANMATKKGMLFVASAGNDGLGFGTWGNHVLTPGDADSALTVGSVNSSGSPAASSGYGPNAAGHVKPDVCGLGQFAAVFTATGYGSGDGTSLSTPQIAGFAACLWQAKPTLTPYQLRDKIRRCASSYSAPGVQLGYGIPNFQCASLNTADTPHPFNSSNWVVPAGNPFTDELQLLAAPNANGNADFALYDMAGRKVASFSAYLYKGFSTPVTIAMYELPVGTYVLKAVNASQQQVLKVEKR